MLDGFARERALRVAGRLGAHLGMPAGVDGGDASLSNGSSGLAVFFAFLDQACQGYDAGVRAMRCLEEAVGVLATAPLPPSLYSGFTGVAWAAQVVAEVLDPEGEDRNDAIDEALLALLRRRGWDRAHYDLVFGLVGLGVYALERLPRPVALDCVDLVIGHLASRASHDDAGAYWWTVPSLLSGPNREAYPDGGVDLGVAHGVAGVIPFLARAATLLPESAAGTLLKGAVRWLLAHAVAGDGGPTIPYFVAEGAELGPARSAWCYGDPGVAAVLLVAAREARESAWEEIATGLAVRAAERPVETSGVTDAGFCHGSAGLGHLFNRMYQMTGERKLADAARFWLQRTLEVCEAAEEAIGGGSVEGRPVPWSGRGVLEGAAGVGLVLLAASTPVEPAWDRMFLVSRLAPRAAGRR
ncbi:MAG: lanthionine synthetase C family protein [Solirubrobacterales bacterium]|nr:lanthionine synthetase C family protein [Solirubrobacterales bacterium]